MSIPLAYNLRNLVVRKTTTLMTALGIALTVSVLLAILSLVSGLRATLESSGDPLKVLVMRKGSDSELVSNFLRAQYQDLKFKPGIATGAKGEPLASLEMVTVVNLASIEYPTGMNVTVRGLMAEGIAMRSHVRLASGRWFDPSRNEMVVGKLVAQRYPGAQIGKRIHVGRSDWDITGVFDAGRGAQNSEIWSDVNRLSADMQRVEVLSSALVLARDRVAAAALIENINNDQRLGMHALSEKEYYELQTASGAPIEFVGIFVSIVMAIGSSFAAMNTMYAAVSRRAREIGTLRVLGFSRGSILTSFFIESVLLSALGGVLGCLLVLPLNGLTTGIGTSSFSELAFDFHMTPAIFAVGIAFAVALGAVGGFFPARMAANKEMV